MLLKCCTQYVNKYGKLSSGQRTRKGQFSFQSQRRAMPKNVQRVKVLVIQLRPTLCDPMYCGLPDSSVHGILQARILGWVAISFSRASSQSRDQIPFSCTSCNWQVGSLPLHHLGSLSFKIIFGKYSIFKVQGKNSF